jgi:DNA-3-methyladenine glycosylase II
MTDHAARGPRREPARRHAGPATPRLVRRAARSGAITAGQAAVELAYRDPTCAHLRAVFGTPVLPKPTLTPFAALANNIVGGPFSSRQSYRLHPRLSPLRSTLTPEKVLESAPSDLSDAGLTPDEIAALRALATASVQGTIHLHRPALGVLDDADIIGELTSVPGIGRDAAQMFLITQLQRLDGWPIGDDELRTGYGIAFDTKAPTPAALDGLGRRYRPFRTVVAWYCWQARAHPETLAAAVSPHGP